MQTDDLVMLFHTQALQRDVHTSYTGIFTVVNNSWGQFRVFRINLLSWVEMFVHPPFNLLASMLAFERLIAMTSIILVFGTRCILFNWSVFRVFLRSSFCITCTTCASRKMKAKYRHHHHHRYHLLYARGNETYIKRHSIYSINMQYTI